MSKPITVVICTYNGENYLTEVIKSILDQEGFDDYVEKLLIVDNASSDNTKSIILTHQKIQPKIEYIYEEKPGLSHARKHGALVDSDWVAYLDDDNILMEGWIVEAIKFISQNPKIGAFNGASIATLKYNASNEEIVMLKAIYKNLACTHYCVEDYKMNLEPAMRGPFGAGMILKVEPLKLFLNEGWTNNVGRKGNELGSGEDGEIVNAILEKGFAHGFNNKMALLHIIPKSRLQKSYVQKLMTGLNQGYYVYISGKKYYIYYRMKTFLKSIFIVMSYPFRVAFSTNEISKLKLKFDFESRIRIIKWTLKDGFILKRK